MGLVRLFGCEHEVLSQSRRNFRGRKQSINRVVTQHSEVGQEYCNSRRLTCFPISVGVFCEILQHYVLHGDTCEEFGTFSEVLIENITVVCFSAAI